LIAASYLSNTPAAFLFVPCAAVVTGGELLGRAVFFVGEGAGDDDTLVAGGTAFFV
jgi:hypothetical protein